MSKISFVYKTMLRFLNESIFLKMYDASQSIQKSMVC